jgi:MATE family multidrug resistance protein
VTSATPWRDEIRAQWRLALPVIAIQLGLMAMGLVDSAFMGRVSAVEFAGTTHGNGLTFTIIGFAMGTLVALDPIISQAYGARDHPAIARGLQRGLVLSLILSVPVGLAIWPAHAVLTFLGQPEEVVPIAAAYSRVAIVGVPPFLIFVAVRQTLQAMHVLRPLLLTILAVNVLNVGLDWVLIFGNLGFPAMGAVGSSWATATSRWAMAIGILVVAWPALGRYLRDFQPRALRLAGMLRTLRVGLPIGVSFFFELGAFTSIALLMGLIDKTAVAGHQVALRLAALAFMVPLGISMAASIRVGNEIGAGRPHHARRAAYVAIASGAGFMGCAALVFWAFPAPLARVFTDLPDVLAIAIVLIPLAAAFQVFDGIQGVAAGVLRGTADTTVPAAIAFAGFWVVGMPLAWYVGIHRGGGPTGLWWALVTAIGVVAAVLLWRVHARFSGPLLRMRIDEADTGPADIS